MQKAEIKFNHIYCGDCLEILKTFPDNSVDLLFTDPPYGKKWTYLYEGIAKESKRVLKGGAFAIFYAPYQFDVAFNMCLKYLNYFFIFSLIHKRHSAIYPKKIFVGSKFIMIFCKGKASPKNWVCNTLSSPIQKKSHPLNWQQSIGEAEILINAYSNKGDIVLDPLIGSGTTAVACKKLERNYVGIEKDQKCYEISKERILYPTQQGIHF